MDNQFKPDSQHDDLPKHLDQFVSDYVPDTEEERKLVRKIDLYLLPAIWGMYLLSYMVRTIMGNAEIAGMKEDLGLDSDKYSISLVVFFIGYVLCGVPSNMILARTKPSIFLPTIMFLWGAVTVAMGWMPNYASLVGLRVVIGILEAGFAPGVLLILSAWYKPNEQSKRFGVYISAAILSGAFGGVIAGAIDGNLDGAHGIAGWRWLFIVEGAACAGWSLVCYFILLDFPATSKRLSERERELAVKRLQYEWINTATAKTTPEERMSQVQALKRSFTNWRTWLFVVGYMAIVGSSTLSYFYPTLVEGLGYSGTTAQYMTIPIYIAAFVCTAVSSPLMDKYPQWRGFALGCWMGIAMICSIIVCAVYDFKARYALLVIMASGLWVSNALALTYASASLAFMNTEVKAISLAFINAMGNLAQIYGSYLFPDNDAPKYLMGFGVISGLCFTGVASYFALHYLLRRFPQ
ncbi:major facilitator superfamily domain-containing protein [Xylariales sp. PMI_506]|nr:major facilitator superfamily domain-containing protein [Xylariales sp. PMI_506]